MNAVTLLRDIETLGAREFRHRLDGLLRRPSHPFRVMLHNKPALAVLPDEDFLKILEILEELKDEGLLERVEQRLAADEKKRQAWFWSAFWQKKERQADRAIKGGKIHRASSAAELVRQLKA